MSSVTLTSSIPQSSSLSISFKTISKQGSVIVAFIGAVVILGWIFHIDTLKSVLPGLVTMKANTALGFILGGISLRLCYWQPQTLKLKRIAQLLSLIVLLIGLLTIIQYGFGVNLGIDQLLFQETVTAVATATPGRMAPNTAFSFLMIGSALLWLHSDRHNPLPIQTFSILTFLVAFLGLLGYFYGSASTYFYQLGPSYTAMALHTAVAFLLLSLSVLFAQPEQGIISVASLNNAGGLMFRRLIPSAIIIPPLVCWIVLLGYRAKVYTPELAICLLSILHVVIFAGLIGSNARRLSSIDKQRYQAELALKQVNEELEQRVAERTTQLTQANERLEQAFYELKATQGKMIQSEKMSSLGQMVAGVAHEINNPVNFIYGNLTHADRYSQDLLKLIALYQQHYPQPSPEIQAEIEAVELDFIEEDLPQILSSMRVGAERIQKIVLSLRNFSRMDEAEFKEVDIHEGIDSTLMILQNRLKAKPDRKEIKILRSYGDLPKVECYAGQLNQVFMNILTNAVDALEESILNTKFPEVPTIQLSTQLVNTPDLGERVLIKIKDNGAGMTEEVRKRLFDPFFTTKPVGKGTGMGMSISYQIITEKHGGTLQCVSDPGQGAEFIIDIPFKHS